MNMLINFIGETLLGLFAIYIIRRKSHAKRISDYFSNAVRVYALTNEKDARVAIITAACVAAKRQRGSMIKYLQSMASEIQKMSENDLKLKPLVGKFIESSIELAEEISTSESTTNEITKQKEKLGKVNSEYLAALEKADPTIFAQKHPRLLK
jgi:pantoate kinase